MGDDALELAATLADYLMDAVTDSENIKDAELTSLGSVIVETRDSKRFIVSVTEV